MRDAEIVDSCNVDLSSSSCSDCTKMMNHSWFSALPFLCYHVWLRVSNCSLLTVLLMQGLHWVLLKKIHFIQ